ncbi:MAG TPA: hypothetical protein VGR28_02245 [Candidatus Thermoplasmatota archaeon]|jgi:hypothetical protein|nr:hypothetical protein [Candidatus Thermoplasmatota archaeon]
MAVTSKDAREAWQLYGERPAVDTAQRRPLKVTLPSHLHIKLHAMKLYRGRSISDTIEAALDFYFEQLRGRDAKPDP